MDWVAMLERHMESLGYVTVTRATELTGHTESSLYGMIHRGRIEVERRRGRVFLAEECLRDIVGPDVYDAQNPGAAQRIADAIASRHED